MNAELASLTATEAAREIATRAITAEDLMRACLARIAERDGNVRAFIHLSPDFAIQEARERDREQQAGRALGPLHGVPVAIKDIFDTIDFPTENGWRLHKDRRPSRDATAAARLRRAGAIVIGKTVTTECAYFYPGATRNPHDLTRTPGGSSSGSAAAVAAGMVPLALGSQTNGSVIRPAAFCGIVGGKPSHGLISRARVLSLSRSLDHIGVFARSVADIALGYDILAGNDPDDSDTKDTVRPEFRVDLKNSENAAPKFGFVRTPKWDEADVETRALFIRFIAGLGKHAAPVDLPIKFNEAWPAHRVVMAVEMDRSFGEEARQGGAEKSSAMLLQLLAEGRDTPVERYEAAIASVPALRAMFESALKDNDVAISLSAKGVAPPIETTGDPVFCTAWSLLGVPAITLPLLQGEGGLPVGVQILGRKGDDARVLHAADWLWRNFNS